MNETYSIEKQKLLDERIDELEAVLLQDEEECELVHTFTPGLYSREIVMLANRVVVSKIHKTEHQFCILRGAAMVRDNEGEWMGYVAPYMGITKPGTRRVLFVIDDCSWVTWHPTDKGTVQEVEEDIIEKRKNTVLGDELDNVREFKKQLKNV